MKVLITGAAGQVGQAIARTAPSEWQVRALARADLDIGDPQQVDALIERERPDLVFNAAAFTAVDRVETEPDLLMRSTGMRSLAWAIAAPTAPSGWCISRRTSFSTEFRAAPIGRMTIRRP